MVGLKRGWGTYAAEDSCACEDDLGYYAMRLCLPSAPEEPGQRRALVIASAMLTMFAPTKQKDRKGMSQPREDGSTPRNTFAANIFLGSPRSSAETLDRRAGTGGRGAEAAASHAADR